MFTELSLVQMHKSYNLTTSFAQNFFLFLSLELWVFSAKNYCAALSNGLQIFLVEVGEFLLAQNRFDYVKNTVADCQENHVSISGDIWLGK